MAWSARTPLVALAVALLVAAPALAQSTTADPFLSPEQVQSRLDALAESPWITLHDAGASLEGRPLRVAVATDPASPTPLEERAVTLVITQQHGNEPAGTPAAIQLLEEIAAGEDVAHALSNQVLVVLPQANPDGAVAGTRGNANGTDLNRDHIALEEPETRAMHAVMNRWRPHVAIDAHEYGGTGLGNPAPVRVYDHDLTILHPRHGNVRAPAMQAAKALMYEGIWPAVEREGYTVNEYGELTAAGIPVTHLAGGPDPGILRNHFGLHHVAGLLTETRVDLHPNPFHDAQRRVDIHHATLVAAVEYVHAHGEFFVAAEEASAEETLRHPHARYVEGDARAPIAEAYRVPADAGVGDAMARHGLEPLVDLGGDPFVDMGQALQGHAAALVHPESSRAIVDGRAAELPAAAGDAAGDAVTPASTAADVPGLTAAAALAALAGLALGRRRD